MDQQKIQLILPAELGADVLSGDEIDASVKASEATILPYAPTPDSLSAHHDFGATIVSILGAAATVEAVKGLFALFRTLVKESHKTKRLR